MEHSLRYVGVLLAAMIAGGTALVSASTGCGAAGSEGASTPGDPDANAGSSGLSSGNTVSDSSFDPDALCAATTVTAKRAPANVLFIVDRSGSMNCNPPPTTTSQDCEQAPVTADPAKPTKWTITRDALKSAIGAMPPSNSAGLTYFNVDDDCAVQATPNVPVKPVDAAHVTLLSQIAFAGQTARVATCNHNASPPDLGDCHFDLTNTGLNLATELNKALDAISKEALSCEYELPAAEAGVVDTGRVNVVYTPTSGAPQTVPQDNSKPCATADGWQYSADQQRIVVCGNACAKLKADGGQLSSVSIQLGCATVVR
jgi:hypothetical protein